MRFAREQAASGPSGCECNGSEYCGEVIMTRVGQFVHNGNRWKLVSATPDLGFL
jgi:hypothetical protein